MKKEEYMGALKGALAGFDEELVQEIVTDYEERFCVGMEKGKTEEAVIQELGSIKDLIDELGEMQRSSTEGFQVGGQKAAEMQTNGNTSGTEQQAEENNGAYEEHRSGTYYQDRSFAESFDSAMKKFGKVLDGVMKEAGRVLEGAAEQFEYHMEEAKKNRHYTYNGDGTWEGSEKDAEGEPNVEKSGQGSEGCRKVVVEADFADVKIRSTRDAEPKAVCHYYSHKTAMLYPFYAKQEGDTFYVGIRRNQDQERKSGFFQFSASPSIEIDLIIPKGMALVEAGSGSGNMELNEVKAEKLVLRARSGDVTANYITCDQVYMEAMSGDLELAKSTAKTTTLNTKSGDCSVYQCEAEKLEVSTASGDVAVKSVNAAWTEINTASGDITADALQGRTVKIHTASGEAAVNDSHGELLEAGTASGDIMIRADYKKYAVKSQSGEVHIESRYDADVTAGSTSGDVEIRFVEALETYRVTMNSVSGDCSTFGQTKSTSNVPTKVIEAKTISGDIQVIFL